MIDCKWKIRDIIISVLFYVAFSEQSFVLPSPFVSV